MAVREAVVERLGYSHIGWRTSGIYTLFLGLTFILAFVSWRFFEKPILELLRVSPETPFEIMTDGQCLVLTPVRDSAEDKKFQAALDMVHKRFGRAMKRLAE